MKNALIVIACLLMLTVPAAAQRPAECEGLATSAGPVPVELAQVCGDPQPVSQPDAPTDTAFGPEASTPALQSMTLNAPGTLTDIGNPGTAFWACDFINNNLTSLLCYQDTNAFVSIDTTTAVVTNLGSGTPAGTDTWTGFAWDGTSGTLYASSAICGSASYLYTVNPANGTATLVGQVTNASCLIAIGADSSGNLFGHDIVDDVIVSIDKATGAGSVLGSTGFDGNFGQGMDFDHDDDTCYLFAFNSTTFVAELRTCDTTTGATTLVGQIGPALVQWGAGSVATADVPVELQRLSVE